MLKLLTAINIHFSMNYMHRVHVISNAKAKAEAPAVHSLHFPTFRFYVMYAIVTNGPSAS